MISADPDGTIVLDDGITTWNPERALRFIAAERDLLRAKLTAHHEMHHVSEYDLFRWAAQPGSMCPVCKEVEHARATGEQRGSSS